MQGADQEEDSRGDEVQHRNAWAAHGQNRTHSDPPSPVENHRPAGIPLGQPGAQARINGTFAPVGRRHVLPFAEFGHDAAVRVRDARRRFEELLAERGLSVESLRPKTAVEALLDSYVGEPAEDAPAENHDGDFGDLVFLEWGTYDWGDGPSFSYSIRRQFFISATDPDAADDGIWALELDFSYQPDLNTAGVGRGGEVCSGLSDVDRFRSLVSAHPATLYAEVAPPTTVELKFGQGG